MDYINGEVVDVPFGVNDPMDKGTPMGDLQTPQIFFVSKIYFL